LFPLTGLIQITKSGKTSKRKQATQAAAQSEIKEVANTNAKPKITKRKVAETIKSPPPDTSQMEETGEEEAESHGADEEDHTGDDDEADTKPPKKKAKTVLAKTVVATKPQGKAPSTKAKAPARPTPKPGAKAELKLSAAASKGKNASAVKEKQPITIGPKDTKNRKQFVPLAASDTTRTASASKGGKFKGLVPNKPASASGSGNKVKAAVKGKVATKKAAKKVVKDDEDAEETKAGEDDEDEEEEEEEEEQIERDHEDENGDIAMCGDVEWCE
jgi:hypothetical protein